MEIFSQKWTENEPDFRPIFRAGKASEIPILGLSLFRKRLLRRLASVRKKYSYKKV